MVPSDQPERRDRPGTVPLPIVADSRPTVRLPRGVRILEATAGLLSAGLLVFGVVLAVLRFAAPTFIHDPGLSTANGPATGRIVAQLVVGSLGELLHVTRARLAVGARPVAAAIVILAVVATLWWSWWR